MGSANCYLVETDTGYILIDTGISNMRTDLEKELESAGCKPGNLKLIVLTHGDFDHAGNCAYLHEKFGTRIAMHYDDSGMVERGDMFWNRESGNILFRFSKSDRFEPDFYTEDGYDFSEYGLDAKVLTIPGHSKGSIGILTAGGDLFCGDLLTNTDKPTLNSIMDDSAAGAMTPVEAAPTPTSAAPEGSPCASPAALPLALALLILTRDREQRGR